MSNQTQPIEASRAVVITDKIFALAALSTLLVSLGLASIFGLLSYFSLREAATLQIALEQSQRAGATCVHDLEYDRGRLEQMEKLVSLASGKTFTTTFGGGIGGPAK